MKFNELIELNIYVEGIHARHFTSKFKNMDDVINCSYQLAQFAPYCINMNYNNIALVKYHIKPGVIDMFFTP